MVFCKDGELTLWHRPAEERGLEAVKVADLEYMCDRVGHGQGVVIHRVKVMPLQGGVEPFVVGGIPQACQRMEQLVGDGGFEG